MAKKDSTAYSVLRGFSHGGFMSNEIGAVVTIEDAKVAKTLVDGGFIEATDEKAEKSASKKKEAKQNADAKAEAADEGKDAA